MAAGLAGVHGRTEAAAVAYLCDYGVASESAEAKAGKLAGRIRLRPFPAVVAESLREAVTAGMDAPYSMPAGVREAEAVFRGMGKSAADDRWPALNWLRDAAVREGEAILVVHGEDGRPAGFVACRRVVAVEIGEGDRLALCYSIRPDYVYVAPARRGTGCSALLRDGLNRAIETGMESLSAEAIGSLPIGFEVLGIAESEEGTRFMEGLRLDMEASAERWFEPSEVQESGCGLVRCAF